VDQLPPSPLRNWLTSAIAANRVTIVPRDAHTCQLLIEAVATDEEAHGPRIRLTASPQHPPCFQQTLPGNLSRELPDALDAPNAIFAPDAIVALDALNAPAAIDALVAALIEVDRLRRLLANENAQLQAARAAAETDYLTGLRSRYHWETRFADQFHTPLVTSPTASPNAWPTVADSFDLALAPPSSSLPCSADSPNDSRNGNIHSPDAWTVLMLDLDGLGRINRAGGMEAGDRWLRFVGDRLRAAASPWQTIVRWGGDEFIAAWNARSRDLARQEAEWLYAAIGRLERPVFATDHLTASAGWAWGPVSATAAPARGDASQQRSAALGQHPLQPLMRLAERALFQAKDLGGRRLCEAS
jgi:diguanylate cyclase (GGDEF)-like protein